MEKYMRCIKNYADVSIMKQNSTQYFPVSDSAFNYQ